VGFSVEIAVKNRGGFSRSIPQRAIQEKIWKVVLSAFGLRYSDDMIRNLGCSFPSYSGEEVVIVITAPKLSCKRGQALARKLVNLGVEMVPSRQFACEVVCLEGTYRATSVVPALQEA